MGILTKSTYLETNLSQSEIRRIIISIKKYDKRGLFFTPRFFGGYSEVNGNRFELVASILFSDIPLITVNGEIDENRHSNTVLLKMRLSIEYLVFSLFFLAAILFFFYLSFTNADTTLKKFAPLIMVLPLFFFNYICFQMGSIAVKNYLSKVLVRRDSSNKS